MTLRLPDCLEINGNFLLQLGSCNQLNTRFPFPWNRHAQGRATDRVHKILSCITRRHLDRTATHGTVKQVFLPCHSTKNSAIITLKVRPASNSFGGLPLGNQGHRILFLNLPKMIQPEGIAAQKCLHLLLIKKIIKPYEIQALAIREVDHRARPV